MSIKETRKPSKLEEKKLIPYLSAFGISVLTTTVIEYFTIFNKAIGDNLYITKTWYNGKEAATHNLIVGIFEKIYGRAYLENRLEAIPFCLILSVVEMSVILLTVYYYNESTEKRR